MEGMADHHKKVLAEVSVDYEFDVRNRFKSKWEPSVVRDETGDIV